jgi:hypothetical protein
MLAHDRPNVMRFAAMACDEADRSHIIDARRIRFRQAVALRRGGFSDGLLPQVS